MNGLLRLTYRKIVGSITIPVANFDFAILGSQRWIPVFFFFLTRSNTNDLLIIHVLNNVAVKTGRRVIAITAWPIWPWETRNDPFVVSFVKGLTPRIRYVWIPLWLQKIGKTTCLPVLRLLQLKDVLYKPLGLSATFRYSDTTTRAQTDILNERGRVLLEIPKIHEQAFQKSLANLGITPDDWFVCVHAREDGWVQQLKAYDTTHDAGYDVEQDGYRNVDIRSYFPAIEHITAQGGYVIRMGDASMQRLPEMDRVIDYPFTDEKSFPFDLFLISRCRFLLGSDAGLSSNFPVAFGTPLLVTNVVSPLVTSRWPYANELVLLQPVVEIETERVMGLRERSHPDISDVHDAILFAGMGYKWEKNSPEDILAGTKEMLHLIETDAFDGEMSTEQEYFHQCRAEAIDRTQTSVLPPLPQWSNVASSESRISASFAKGHFEDEAKGGLALFASARNSALQQRPNQQPLEAAHGTRPGVIIAD